VIERSPAVRQVAVSVAAKGQAFAFESGYAHEAQDDRIHEDDVGHDHERGQTSPDLPAECRAQLGEMKEARHRGFLRR
jgi:hypothetical protein